MALAVYVQIVCLDNLWDEVMRRLGCGDMLFVTARPAPMLDEEIKHIQEIVGHCHVASVYTEKYDLERLLFCCDVLYVGGMHDQALSCIEKLGTLKLSLAILNVCRSEKLAKHLLSQGVGLVSYWPAAVHDAEAVAFGISFVQNLFRLNIAEAFAEAVRKLPVSERAPRLLSRTGRDKQRHHFPVGDVILESRGSNSGKPSYAEHVAQILRHTAFKGWVKVHVAGEVINWRVGHWRMAGSAGHVEDCRKDTSNLADTLLESGKALNEVVCPQTLLEEDLETEAEEAESFPAAADVVVDDCNETQLDEDSTDEDEEWLRELCWRHGEG